MNLIQTLSKKINTLGSKKTITEANAKEIGEACAKLGDFVNKCARCSSCKAVGPVVTLDTGEGNVEVCSECAIKLLKSLDAPPKRRSPAKKATKPTDTKSGDKGGNTPKTGPSKTESQVKEDPTNGKKPEENLPFPGTTEKTPDQIKKEKQLADMHARLKKNITAGLAKTAIKMEPPAALAYLRAEFADSLKNVSDESITLIIGEIYAEQKLAAEKKLASQGGVGPDDGEGWGD